MSLRTIAKLYPIQSPSQLRGHSGTFMSWLWTASTFAFVSHTTHLMVMRCHKSGEVKHFIIFKTL